MDRSGESLRPAVCSTNATGRPNLATLGTGRSITGPIVDRQTDGRNRASQREATPASMPPGLGRTPRQQLIWLRMRKAAELLSERSSTVESIATRVGYKNPFVFSSIFKRVMGWSPPIILIASDEDAFTELTDTATVTRSLVSPVWPHWISH